MGQMKAVTAADLIVLELRSVDDPMETTAQLVAKRAKKPGDPRVGKIDVMGNAMTRIGALCFVRRRLKHHDRAAERFKSLYEGLYGSGMPAVDAGRISVDNSITAHDGGIAGRLDRGAALGFAIDMLGKPAADLVVAVVVLGVTCSSLASLPGWRAREHVVDELLAALDRLSDKWGYGRAVA